MHIVALQALHGGVHVFHVNNLHVNHTWLCHSIAVWPNCTSESRGVPAPEFLGPHATLLAFLVSCIHTDCKKDVDGGRQFPA